MLDTDAFCIFIFFAFLFVPVQLVETTVPSPEGPRPNIAQHLRPVDELLQHAKVRYATVRGF